MIKKTNCSNFNLMRASKKKINSNLKKEIVADFYQLLADLKNPLDIQRFLEAFLTKAELQMLTKRLAISHLLNQNVPYNEIKKRLAVSSATIATVQSLMKKKPQDFTLALKDLEADKWASETSKKIADFLKSLLPQPATAK